VATPTAPSLSTLYQTNPGVTNVAQPAASTTGTVGTTNANSTNANALTASADTVASDSDPNTNAGTQLDAMTSQDSPEMQLASQQGLLTAGSRGLLNSSLASGASEASMAAAATPLAEQNASQAQTQDLTNQAATNTANITNAQLGTSTAMENAQNATSVNEANAAAANAASQTNAQMQTQNSQFNAGMKETVGATNAAAANSESQAVMAANSSLNNQYLAGTQAQSLAQIQGQYNQLISSNTAASSLYSSFFSSISSTMANSNITPQAMAAEVGTQQTLLSNGLAMIDAMNNITLPGSVTKTTPISTSPTTGQLTTGAAAATSGAAANSAQATAANTIATSPTGSTATALNTPPPGAPAGTVFKNSGILGGQWVEPDGQIYQG
jgi:hypothetical protein